jgi:hypothetical protein
MTVVVDGEVAPDLTLRTLVAVLVAQALEDPLGGVALLLGGGLILLADLVNWRCCPSLRSSGRASYCSY